LRGLSRLADYYLRLFFLCQNSPYTHSSGLCRGSGRKALTVDKSHDNIVVKAKTGRDYHGISAGKMSALRK
jgi:hypothetical protein